MSGSRTLRRCADPLGVLALLALLTSCSPPVIGAVTLARHPDGSAVAVVVLCRGAVTHLDVTYGPPGEPDRDGAVSWSGHLSAPGVTGIRFTDWNEGIVSGSQYAVRGRGVSDDEFLGFSAGQANLRSESQIDGSTLAQLAPGEVVSWDAATRRSVAVPLEEYREGVCSD